ncbi:BMP family protein [Oscillibacter sp. MSJ-2]|uniref:BMP family protein n=1 Tax=Dysosmobacter acutus TaxID=2841504 RepID=A0ABS6FBC8_9FIRM|nr:BMP family protein [Dysosmobacter acutus]MBU5626634.1 BMP family protein [Dysosmobacter acutus]
MKKVVSLILTLMMVLSLAACGGSGSGGSASGSGSSGSAGAGEYDAKVALCLVSPANDGAWSSYAYNAVMAAKELYNIDVKYTENVKPTDMEAVFTDYAAQGFDLIIGHSFSFGDAALAVAERYPDVSFAIIDGTVEADNVASYNLKTQESGYIQGVLAAAMSKTGKIGAVAGVEGPAIIKVAEAYKVGARAQNPDIEVMTAYTGSFDDAAKSKEAAQAMIDKGADIIMGGANQSNAGMIKACEEAGVYCMGELDQQSLAPQNVLLCNLSDIENLVAVAVKEVVEGTFSGGIHEYGYADNVLSLTDYGELDGEVPQEVKDLVTETMEKIKSGEIEVPRIEQITND